MGNHALINAAIHQFKSGRRSEAMDTLFDWFEERMQDGAWPVIDDTIRTVDVANCPTEVLLGILTASLPGSAHQPSRPALFEAIQSTIKARGEFETGLLDGLDEYRPLNGTTESASAVAGTPLTSGAFEAP